MGNKKAPTHKKRNLHPFPKLKWGKVIGKTITLGGSALFLLFAVIRFINPPTSALMIIRACEAYVWGHSELTMKGWTWVRLSQISPHLQQSVVVAEDAQFMKHWGIDFSSLLSVLSGEGRHIRAPRGASTITMQTVKNLFLWPGRSYLRKGIELIISPIFNLTVGKRRTLEIYLNIAEWGPGIYGAEAASRRYFGKSAKNLSLSESAALAAVLPSPLTTSPRSMSSAARRRMTRILREVGSASLP